MNDHDMERDLMEAGRRLRASTAGATDESVAALRTRRRRARGSMAAVLAALLGVLAIPFVSESPERREVITGPTPERDTSGPTRVYDRRGTELLQYRKAIDPAMAHVADAIRRLAVTDDDLRPALEQAGVSGDVRARDQAFLDGGFQIETTIEADHQQALHDVVPKALGDIGPDAVVSVLDVQTGDTKAIYGGRTVGSAGFSLPYEQARQIGGLVFPFAMATALEAGVDPNEPITPMGDLNVANADGAPASPLTMGEGLRRGSATTFAALGHRLGHPALLDMEQSFGIQGNEHGGVTEYLGVATANTTTMASAYSAFANGGRRILGHAITRVLDRNGKVIHTFDRAAYNPSADRARPPMSAATAAVVRDALTAAQIGVIPVDGARSFGMSATTQEFRDAWFAGVVEDLSIAVWVGFTDATPRSMRPPATPEVVTGRTVPARIWHDAAVALLAKSGR